MLSQTPAALLLLLLAAHAALVRGGEAGRTFRRPDTGRLCDRCPPGRFLLAPCTEARPTDCAACPADSFTALWNYIERCLPCATCNDNQEVVANCTGKRDTECRCRSGHFYRDDVGVCEEHRACPPGEGVVVAGTAGSDTLCAPCSRGSYSQNSSTHQACSAHTPCATPTQLLLLEGSAWHDNVCTSSTELETCNRAHFLRQVLLTFLLRQKTSTRCLRRLVLVLPPAESGRRQQGTHKLRRDDLVRSIGVYARSAEGEQLRRLPERLREACGWATGHELTAMFKRVDERVDELCRHAVANRV